MFSGNESISGWTIKTDFKPESRQTGLPGQIRWRLGPNVAEPEAVTERGGRGLQEEAKFNPRV